MKQIIFLLAVAFLFLGATQAQAAKAKLLVEQRHSQWQSFVLSGQHVNARMSTQGIDDSEGTTLVVDAYPDTCGTSTLKIVSCQKAFEGRNEEYTVAGSIRVDRRSIFDVEYAISIADSCMFITPRSRNFSVIANDLRAGSYVRFKINFSSDPHAQPVYKRYSLSGFTAAHQRISKLCEDVRKILRERNDADFFKEAPARPQTPNPPVYKPAPQKDSDFFI